MAKITQITKARRLVEADVTKLVCNCDPSAYLFRVTVVADKVSAECGQCLQEFGPFFLTQTATPEQEN